MRVLTALAQIEIIPSDPEKNLERMESFIRQATKQGAQLIVFPEDAITGPLAGQTAFVARAPEFLAACQTLAVKYSIDLVPGSWTAQFDGLLFNVAYYINRDGSIAGSYRKINLWDTEKAVLTPGTTVSVFPTAHGMVGLIICWDISFPALFAEMVRQGVRFVISPTYWSFPIAVDSQDEVDDEILLVDSLCTTRSFENNIVFAYCNAAGELKTDDLHVCLGGRSQITHPLDKVLCKADGNAEELLLAMVDIDG